MATVNNATGVYATLGYNFDDPNGDVKELSNNTIAHMNTMPVFIKTWQAQDIANNAVDGYNQNIMAEPTQLLMDTANSIISLCSQANGVIGLETINSNAHTLANTANSFLYHTNRITGLDTRFDEINKPYYTTAVALGKTAIYITNQTDGITNTSPIMGSFTSLLIGPQVNANVAIVSTYPDIISDSITLTTDIMTGGISATSNLSPSQISEIENGISTVNGLLYDRYTGDITYYTNLKSFIEKYNTTKQFVNMGETETYLVNNFIGTPKLLSRINS